MKNKITVISFLFFFIAFCVSCSTVSEVFLTEVNHVPQNQKTAYSGENIRAKENADGTTAVKVFASSVDNAEKYTLRLEHGNYLSNTIGIQKQLPQKISYQNGIKLISASNTAEIMPEDENEYESELKQTVNIFRQTRQTLSYKNFFGQDTDLDCSATTFGINTEMKLETNPAKPLRIKFKLPNTVVGTESPEYITFKNMGQTKEVQAILYAPLVMDKNGELSIGSSVKIIEKDEATGIYTVEYGIDESVSKYPVTLNQSIHMYKPKQPDSSVYEKASETDRFYLSPYMIFGDDTVKGKGITMVRFETLDTIKIRSEDIVSAKYTVHNLSDLDHEIKIGAYAVTSFWCSINSTWYNKPRYDEKPVSQIAVRKRGDYSFDITKLIKEILKNKEQKNKSKYTVENSFLLQSDQGAERGVFASGDNGLFSPVLEFILK